MASSNMLLAVERFQLYMQNNQDCNNQFVSQQATEPEAEKVSTFVSQMQEIGYPGSHTEEMCHQQTDEPELDFDGEAENKRECWH